MAKKGRSKRSKNGLQTITLPLPSSQLKKQAIETDGSKSINTNVNQAKSGQLLGFGRGQLKDAPGSSFGSDTNYSRIQTNMNKINCNPNMAGQTNDIDRLEEEPIKCGDDFITGRVGSQLYTYHEDFGPVLEEHISDSLDDGFLLAPIESPRSMFNDEDLYMVPDFASNSLTWVSRIAVHITHLPIGLDDEAKRFDKIFQHALCLPTMVVVVTCPESITAQLTIASVVNDRLNNVGNRPLVLFKMSSRHVKKNTVESQVLSDRSNSGSNSKTDSKEFSQNYNLSDESSASRSSGRSGHKCESPITRQWRNWNTFRRYLVPDLRIGLCLELCEDLDDDIEELAKWMGEPVRMIIISADKFVASPQYPDSIRLPGRMKEFIKTIVVANSFKTSLVLEAGPRQQARQLQLKYLNDLQASFRLHYTDKYPDWDDKVQVPLQPLSMNLDSGTYGVFETDKVKYMKYKQAFIEALDYLIMKFNSKKDKFTIMVLGAGRGPLVDVMLEAIGLMKSMHKYKIFALDKNYSSVRSLQYKQRYIWPNANSGIEIEVVEADMRTWEPGVKADLIATELLGSFGDNELSPECIDGTWRFSHKETISIPQSYSSYIAPISSYRMQQEMAYNRRINQYAYDQIYVVKLSNHYLISRPKKLFTFEHMNLSLEKPDGANERFKRMKFYSKTQTLCHGFAGYFTATLFGNTVISTVPAYKTPDMYSWFPVFIPLEKPIKLSQGTKMELFFSRKDSPSKVWYEWAILSPDNSRIHSPQGINTAMSKQI